MKFISHLFLFLVAFIVSAFLAARRQFRRFRADWFPRRRPLNPLAKPAKTCKDIAAIIQRAMDEERSAYIVVDKGGYVYEPDDNRIGPGDVQGVIVEDSAYYASAKIDVRHDGRTSVVRSRPSTLRRIVHA